MEQVLVVVLLCHCRGRLRREWSLATGDQKTQSTKPWPVPFRPSSPASGTKLQRRATICQSCAACVRLNGSLDRLVYRLHWPKGMDGRLSSTIGTALQWNGTSTVRVRMAEMSCSTQRTFWRWTWTSFAGSFPRTTICTSRSIAARSRALATLASSEMRRRLPGRARLLQSRQPDDQPHTRPDQPSTPTERQVLIHDRKPGDRQDEGPSNGPSKAHGTTRGRRARRNAGCGRFLPLFGGE